MDKEFVYVVVRSYQNNGQSIIESIFENGNEAYALAQRLESRNYDSDEIYYEVLVKEIIRKKI